MPPYAASSVAYPASGILSRLSLSPAHGDGYTGDVFPADCAVSFEVMRGSGKQLAKEWLEQHLEHRVDRQGDVR